MTAEVAILNKTAIAVAADSAVTVGKTKVHRSVTKIFAISEAVPIGAMIYGYAELGGMPWETMLKLFRAEHGRERFATVADCYERIREFLAEPRFRLEKGSDESLARFAISVVEWVKDRLAALQKNERNADALTHIIQEETKEYLELQGQIRFESPTLSWFRREGRGIVIPVVREVFQDIDYRVPASVLPKFTELVFTALNSPYVSDYMSGLVVFGFGHDELFPHLWSHEFDPVPFGRLRSRLHEETSFDEAGPFILPFADREVMDTLITGASNHLRDFYVEALRVAAEETATRIIKDYLAPDDQMVASHLSKTVINDIVGSFRTRAEEHGRRKYVYKMIEVIENMPKEELAVLAEALVEVTALRIKASEPVESVAGPVDVCVVTKGDGLIWIKRKHYFDLSKNLQYLYRRFGSASPIFTGGDDAG